MKKLLALGLAFTTLTQIIQKVHAASFRGSGAFSAAGGSIEPVANFESFSSAADFSIITDQLTHALNGRYTPAQQKALCRRLEAILKPEAFAAIEPKRMEEFLDRVKATSGLIRANLTRLNAENKEFVELGEAEVADLTGSDFERLQDTAFFNHRKTNPGDIADRLQNLIALDAKALTQTSGNIGRAATALSGQDTKAYRESVVSFNFWEVLGYFGESKWYDHEDKEYFARSFINFVHYVAGLSPQNKQMLLESGDGRKIPVSKYLVQDAPFSLPQQLVYAYALLNAGYDAPAFLIATAQLVERSQEDPISKHLLRLLVATILNNKSDTDLANAILRSLKTRKDSELFLLRYHVILADTDQALASLGDPAAQRAYEQDQARLRATDQRRVAAWLTEEAQREAAQREALELQKALELQRARKIEAQLQATALREAKLKVFRTKSLQKRREETARKIQRSFRAKKEAEKQLNKRADAFRAQKLEQAKNAAKKATFDALRNEVTEAKAIATIAGVRAGVAAKKENERRKQSLRIAQQREAMERLRKEELAIAQQRQAIELSRAALAQKEAELLRAQEEAASRRVRDVAGADALWNKERKATVAERDWAAGLSSGGAAVRSVEGLVKSIADALSTPDIIKAKNALTMRPSLALLASKASFSQAVRELAALAPEDQAPIWRAIKAALTTALVNIDVLASVKGIADEAKAETIRLLQKGLKTE